MKIRREVKFTKAEVSAMTHEAFRLAAIGAIGAPTEHEELELDISDYGESTATLKPKSTNETEKEVEF